MTPVYPRIARHEPRHATRYERSVVPYWGFFSERELQCSPGALLMLDIDLGRRCSLRCRSCFRRDNSVDDSGPADLTYAELLAVLDEAQRIGLKQVKICGAGEPLESPLLLALARDLTARDVGLSIFTKGHVLGDDSLVAEIYGDDGIADARTLCEEFFRLKTSFLVSFQSAHVDVQDRLVGEVPGYSEKRNLGLELLAEAGFNKPSPTRLAMCANPMMKANIGELFDIYVYARERNILPVNAALMVSSRKIDRAFLAQHDPGSREKEELFTKIYEYNLRTGIQSADDLAEAGISCMPGIHPCNQIAAGLYLTCNGNVIRCPGDSERPLGNVREQSIAEIWQRCREWKFTGVFNCGCPYKDGVTLPEGIYARTLEWLLSPTVAATND